MTSKLLTATLITSKSNLANLQSIPSLKSVRFELTSDGQHLDTFFSDSVHTLWVAGGSLPLAKKQSWAKSGRVLMTKSRRKTDKNSWLINYPIEESWVAFAGSDTDSNVIYFDTTRTFLDSSIENDLKYRLDIQEYYLDRASFKLVFNFSKTSGRTTRAKELRLRRNYWPVRLVERLIN